MKRTRTLYDDDSSSSESEDFHRRKQRLKVNIAEEGSEEDDNNSPPPHQPAPQVQMKHFCVICNKQFGSGKAYGGHVRIHSSEYSNKGKMKKMKIKKKKKGVLVKKEREKEIDLIRADVEGKIKCCLCGKEFQTMHSLFGHMRRHPDRSWKGIRPPPTPEKFNLSSYLGDDADDLDDLDDDEDDYYDDHDDDDVMSDVVTEDVQEAACILMMLSYTSRNYWEGMKKAMEESPKSEVRSSSCHKDGRGVDGGKEDGKKGLIVDMKIKMDNELKVNNKPRDDEAKRSLGFDLNEPPPYSCWN